MRKSKAVKVEEVPVPKVPFEQYIEDLMRVCQRLTRTEEYTMKVIFEPKNHEDNDDHSSVNASIKVDSVYLWVTIRIYPILKEKYENGNVREVAYSILHEFCHILTEPMAREMMVDAAPTQACLCREIVERQTERIANAIGNASKEEWWN